MGLLIVVVPIAVAIVVAALVAFRWAVKSGQLDDLETPAVRMLHDDEPVRSSGEGPPVAEPSAAEPSASEEERS